MSENRIIEKIQKALREHGSIGVLRQMHFGEAFYKSERENPIPLGLGRKRTRMSEKIGID